MNRQHAPRKCAAKMNWGKWHRVSVVFLFLALATPSFSWGATSDDSLAVTIRGHVEALRRYPEATQTNRGPAQKVVLASGDGGFGSFDKAIAKRLSAAGYDVYELNTRNYLADFTGEPSLKPVQVVGDFSSLVHQIRSGSDDHPLLIGWSAGAALVVTAAATDVAKREIAGVIAISLPREGALGWRWWDRFQFLPGIDASGPLYSVIPFLSRIAPLNLAIIQSTGDRWVSEQDVEDIFDAAREQRTVLLEAGGHNFSSDRTGFFRELNSALSYVLMPAEARPAN